MSQRKVERFYRLHAPFYDVTRRFFLFKRKRAVSLLGVRPQDRVADFGCGTGMNAKLLSQYPEISLTGMDFSESMLKVARKKYPHVRWVRGDLEAISLEEKFDKALCTYALSLVNDWRQALKQMSSLIEPGGNLVILDFSPLKGPLNFLDPVFDKWFRSFRVFRKRDFKSELELYFENVVEESPAVGYLTLVVGRKRKN